MGKYYHGDFENMTDEELREELKKDDSGFCNPRKINDQFEKDQEIKEELASREEEDDG